MGILTLGSDMSLAPAVGPILRYGDGTLRGTMDALSKLGFSALQLDATLSGLRPRELSPRARKDLCALLSRQDMRLAGIDLFLPRSHFLDSAHLDRAMAATLAAIELAADLGKVPLSIVLPIRQLEDDARTALAAAADGHGVTLAIHAEDQLDELLKWLNELDLPAVRAALDGASLLACGRKPQQVVHQFANQLAVGRLSDAQGAGGNSITENTGSGVRCSIGDGDLPLQNYRLALELAKGRHGPVVLDLRGVGNPIKAAKQGKKAWEGASPM